LLLLVLSCGHVVLSCCVVAGLEGLRMLWLLVSLLLLLLLLLVLLMVGWSPSRL
jgi:hypothetical protein